jgi:hypothetical protein
MISANLSGEVCDENAMEQLRATFKKSIICRVHFLSL